MESIKRGLDIFLSLMGLLFVFPLFPIIGLLIKLDSRGPVFYLADRIGKGGKIFKMYKFRTMQDTPIEVGQSVSPQYDPRVTPFGRFLRRTKLNELPQLINILKGDMTFVGPRPEAPDLAELYPEEARRVFSVKPGLVGPNAILGRNEEELYPPGVDAKQYYIDKILPNKVKIDLEYLDNSSLFKDLRYILMGVKETLSGAINQRHIYNNRTQIYLLACDAFIIILILFLISFFFSHILTTPLDLTDIYLSLPVILCIRILCNLFSGMYSSLIRYISYHEIKGVAKGVFSGSTLLIFLYSVFGWPRYWGFAAALDSVCLFFLLSSIRLGLRLYWDKSHRKNDIRQKHRILIYGAGDAGYAAYRALSSDIYWPFDVVGFVDDAPDKYGKSLNGKKILGTRHHIPALARLYRIDEILISEAGSDWGNVTEIIRICQESGLKYRIFSTPHDWGFMSRSPIAVRNVEISDILPLKRFYSDQLLVREILADKTIVLYGGGGSLGLELCRKLLQSGCKKIIIVERYESYLNELTAGLFSDFSPKLIVPVLISSSNGNPLEPLFKKNRPDIIFHAALRKYDPILQFDTGNIGRINDFYTSSLAKAALNSHCGLFVAISSFLPVEGKTFLADSVRFAETLLHHFFADTSTRLIICRLCDIAENRGSPVSIIEDQVKNRKTITLPSEAAQTFLVSKYSAVEFLLQALVEASKNPVKNQIYSFPAGTALPLISLAKQIAAYYGLRLGVDIGVKYLPQPRSATSILPESDSISPSLLSPVTLESSDNAVASFQHSPTLFNLFDPSQKEFGSQAPEYQTQTSDELFEPSRTKSGKRFF